MSRRREQRKKCSQVSRLPLTAMLSNVQLWCRKRVLPLTRQTFTVLRSLLDHAGQVVTKTELFAALWPETAVSDGE
jgi:DNA-binding response OmpR family regulator